MPCVRLDIVLAGIRLSIWVLIEVDFSRWLMVVIDSHRPELRIKFRQLGAIFDRPCWFFLFPCFFELKNHDFGVVFIPARGKAFSGSENGFVCHKTHLAIFRRKSKIRP